jgi:NDP-sugar pyrophosphorylase family protein
LLDQLIAAEIESVILCIGYLGQRIKKALGDKYRSLHIEYSQETEPLGTAGALRLASPLLGINSVLVMNGDSYFETNIQDFFKRHKVLQASISMLLTEVSNASRFGRVSVDNYGKITRFKEKGININSGWINAGIYVLENSVIQSIPTNHPVSLEHDIFPERIGQGLYGVKSKGHFIDIGTPSSYEKAQEFLMHLA